MEGSIKEVLESLGYHLQRENYKYYRTRPLYRESSNPTSVRICRETGRFWDFSANIFGNIEELVRLTLNLTSIEDAKEWLGANATEFKDRALEERPKIRMAKVYDKNILKRLLPHYDFYTKKGISIKTLKVFNSGMASSEAMRNRFVFPIFNEDQQIVGFAGRTLVNHDIKWKLMGDKRGWLFPLYMSRKYIEEKREVIIVESIGDMLALWEAGIKNVFVIFGVAIFPRMISAISCMGIDRVIIATNDDFHKKDNTGKINARKIQEKLEKFINPESVSINLPPLNDFGASLEEGGGGIEEILDWYESTKVS